MATHPSSEAFRLMVDEFEELTGIKVRWDIMEEIYLHDKILTEHAARTARYDVLMMDVCWIGGEFAARRVIVPLDEYLNDPSKTPKWFNYEDIVPAYSKGLGMFDDKVYGIPSAGESAFIAYRKDLFEKYDYDPASIKTFDDLMEAAAFFHGKEDGLSGISMRGDAAATTLSTDGSRAYTLWWQCILPRHFRCSGGFARNNRVLTVLC